LEIISNDSPELLDLLADFKEKVKDVKNNLLPLIQKVKNGEMPMSKGISFLELKYHLMLSYCTNITFYLLLKASGESVKDHPVIGQLVEIRTVMEKIKPLEQKLQYQIDKLIKIANTGVMPKDDPLRFKPNPANLKSDRFEGDEDEEAEEVYRPAKIAPVHYEEPSEKIKKQEERIKQKARRSLLIKELKDEILENPEEIMSREEVDEADRLQIEREQHEEEWFVRLPVTKKDKKKKKPSTFLNELETLNDFGDLAALEKTESMIGLMKKGKKESKKGSDKVGKRNEEDDSILDALNDMAGGLDGEDEEFNDGDLAFYNQTKNAQQQEKNQKKKEKQQKKREEAEEANVEDIEGEEADDSKRGLTNSILKNKGLTVKRKKELKNPRVKKRMKYEQAQKKMKSIRPEVKQKSTSYGGEFTGIKANVTKSIKLK